MKRIGTSILAVLALSASGLFAATFDGMWQGEMKTPARKGAETRSVMTTLDLHSEGDAVKGTLSFGKKGKHTVEIKDGKVDGDKLVFTTTRETPKGPRTRTWEGTFAGDELHVTAGSGRKRPGTTLVLKRV